MMKKMQYEPPRVERIRLNTEQILDTDFSQIELPDHNWDAQKPISIFPEKV